MDDFYYEESESKHVFLKCLIILFILGIFVGIFLYYKNENTIKLKKMHIELGSSLSNNINDYLISGKKLSEYYKLDTSKVDTMKEGKYSYKVKYNKHVEEGTIIVEDTTPPKITSSDITINVKEEFDFNYVVSSCKDYSLPCSVSIVNKKDLDKLKTVGKYQIPFYVEDNAGNKVKTDINIVVSETESLSTDMSNDLEYYTNSKNDDNIEHVYFKKFDKALKDESVEYETMIQEVSAIDFSELTDKEIYNAELITVYNKYGYVIGIQVLITYTDGSKELLES